MAETSSSRRRVRRRSEAGVMGRLVGGRAAVGVGLILLLLAGCSASGGSGATTTTSGQQAAAAVAREFVRCARANGMPNMPDLRLDSNGQVSIPPGTPTPPKSVERACKSILDRLPASASREVVGEGEQPPPDLQALLRYARCMRKQGVADFPDPKADGSFPAGPSTQRRTPRARAADRACRQFNPDAKGRIRSDG